MEQKECNLQDMQEADKKITRMTTVAIDKYGVCYDLSYEHPSWEQAKKGNETINIVANAFTCTKEYANLLKKKKKKK